MLEHPGLKQFRQEGCLSYIFFDAAKSGRREAIIVDPRADLMEEYREYLAEWSLEPVLVVDTALHWHHLSGSHLFVESYRIPVAMSARTECERVTQRLHHGDEVRAGRWSLKTLETPGVATDAICLQGQGLLLAGDTLQIGAAARTDLPGGDVAALWNSLQKVLSVLPQGTIVLPGFDRPGFLFSTLEVEKKKNPDWRHATAAQLASAKAEEDAPRGEGDIRRRLEYNRSTHPSDNAESHWGSGMPPSPSLRDNHGMASISVEKYAQKLKGRTPGTLFVDVRERSEFVDGHMPGVLNFPLSELSLYLDKIAAAKRVYVSCRIGRRSRLAVRTLDYLGFSDIVDVSGGFQAWKNAGLPVTEG
jgi:rhodanese-related sulfurtransferase/glyoxylase-like metal-dependent hydrolase (beta-lactamase superfamily II)